MANMHLVTGFAGYEHITSADQGLLNSYFFGDLEVVLNRGNRFEASIISNNIIRVKDGDLMMQGRFARLNDDNYVDLTIDNGTQGYFRNDLIVARYRKDVITTVETIDLVVIKGENAASDPVDPAYVKGDIKSGKDFQNDVPLWRVSLDGLNVAGLTCLFSTFGMTLESIGADAYSHIENNENPHNVTAQQVPVSESAVSAMKETGSWSVDGMLTHFGSILFGTDTLYRWNKQKSQPVVTATGRTAKTSASSILSYPTIYYSSEVTADANGKMTLVNPSTLSFEVIMEEKSAAMLEGYYISFNKSGTKLYKVTETTAYRSWSEGVPPTAWYYELSNLVEYSWGLYSELLTSKDPNAYTDGYVDAEGYTYVALEPVTAFVPRMQEGSYVGTGTYGASNTCSLTFSFEPKMVLIRGKSTKAEFYMGSLTSTLAQNGFFYGASTGTNYYAAINDKTLSWYASAVANQMNTANEEYYWFAIG